MAAYLGESVARLKQSLEKEGPCAARSQKEQKC
jgi:hypothetical protein